MKMDQDARDLVAQLTDALRPFRRRRGLRFGAPPHDEATVTRSYKGKDLRAASEALAAGCAALDALRCASSDSSDDAVE